ncbi:hypothetical protein CLU81_0507 [Flavobacterium sp. 9]|nr:hypothetical protein CLU81_0507 [Flavobacterium sp. 9]
MCEKEKTVQSRRQKSSNKLLFYIVVGIVVIACIALIVFAFYMYALNSAFGHRIG